MSLLFEIHMNPLQCLVCTSHLLSTCFSVFSRTPAIPTAGLRTCYFCCVPKSHCVRHFPSSSSPPAAVYYPARETFLCLHSGLCNVAVSLSNLLITEIFLSERHENDTALLSFRAHFLLAGDHSALRTGTFSLPFFLHGESMA